MLSERKQVSSVLRLLLFFVQFIFWQIKKQEYITLRYFFIWTDSGALFPNPGF
jgi:hypothetical protein